MVKVLKLLKQERQQQHDYYIQQHRKYAIARTMNIPGHNPIGAKLREYREEHKNQADIESRLIVALEDCEDQLWKAVYDRL